MKHIRLTRGGAARTTQLGFGCAYVSRANADILDVAYDAGIRHFDVARSYDHGRAEGLLGQRLRLWPEATVTTKYGLRPAYRNAADHALRKSVRGLASALKAPVPAWLDGSARKAAFTCDDLMQSLRISQVALGRSEIDLLLLHEATIEDLGDPGLLERLLDLRANGTIGDFGVGGPAHRLPGLVERRPEWCPVLQYDWSPLRPTPAPPGTRAIFYRSFAAAARELAQRLADDAALARRWSDLTGIDLAAPRMLTSLMLRAALISSPDALILFSTAKAENITHAVAVAEDASLDEPARRLVELARA